MGEESLGHMIKRRRETLGFSQARLGELVGRSASTIRNWERDKSTPSVPSDAVALAAVLGLSENRVWKRPDSIWVTLKITRPWNRATPR